MIRWLLRIFRVAALAGFAAAVWIAGPLIGFADGKPLEPAWIRATIIGGRGCLGGIVLRHPLGAPAAGDRSASRLAVVKADDPDSDSDSGDPRNADGRCRSPR